MTNINLAEKVLRSILDHPDEHDQMAWFSSDHDGRFGLNKLEEGSCGTTACVAGWALLHSNYLFEQKRDRNGNEVLTLIGPERSEYGEPNWEGVGKAVSDKAMDELGFTEEEAGAMFYSDDDEAVAMLYLAVKGVEDWSLMGWDQLAKVVDDPSDLNAGDLLSIVLDKAQAEYGPKEEDCS